MIISGQGAKKEILVETCPGWPATPLLDVRRAATAAQHLPVGGPL